MATGPDHYRQAENHLDLAAIADTEVSRGTNLLFAVGHALLAQAAAVALGSDAMPPADWRVWRSMAGEAGYDRQD